MWVCVLSLRWYNPNQSIAEYPPPPLRIRYWLSKFAARHPLTQNNLSTPRLILLPEKSNAKIQNSTWNCFSYERVINFTISNELTKMGTYFWKNYLKMWACVLSFRWYSPANQNLSTPPPPPRSGGYRNLQPDIRKPKTCNLSTPQTHSTPGIRKKKVMQRYKTQHEIVSLMKESSILLQLNLYFKASLIYFRFYFF